MVSRHPWNPTGELGRRWAAKRRGFRARCPVDVGPLATGTIAALPRPWLPPTLGGREPHAG